MPLPGRYRRGAERTIGGCTTKYGTIPTRGLEFGNETPKAPPRFTCDVPSPSGASERMETDARHIVNG